MVNERLERCCYGCLIGIQTGYYRWSHHRKAIRFVHVNLEWKQGDYLICTDPARLDADVIHAFLTESYWAAGITREVVKRSIRHSLSFGLYKGERQIGFARVITDYATFAYLADVFVLTEFRGEGLGRWLIEVVVSHPELSGLRRWMLATRDAHGLYGKSGFTELEQPKRWMEKHAPNVYVNSDTAKE